MHSTSKHNIGFIKFLSPSLKLVKRKKRFTNSRFLLFCFISIFTKSYKVDGSSLNTLNQQLVIEVYICVVMLIEICYSFLDVMQILIELLKRVRIMISQVELLSLFDLYLKVKFIITVHLHSPHIFQFCLLV